MDKNLSIELSVEINAPEAEVWKTLTDGDRIREYLFGTNVNCSWQKGAPIVFSGEYNGMRYEDKGVISDIIPGKLLQYTYWSSMSGTGDLPENYSLLTFSVVPSGDKKLLAMTQSGFGSEQAREHSLKNWSAILQQIKNISESAQN